MQKQVSPVVVAVILGVVAIAIILVGYKMIGPKGFNADTTGSEKDMQRVQKGERLYTPPAGAPVPGAGGSMSVPGSGPSMPGGVPTGGPGGMMGGAMTGPPGGTTGGAQTGGGQ